MYITSLEYPYVVRSVFTTGEMMDTGCEYRNRVTFNALIREQWETGGYESGDCVESFAFDNRTGEIVAYMIGVTLTPRHTPTLVK